MGETKKKKKEFLSANNREKIATILALISFLFSAGIAIYSVTTVNRIKVEYTGQIAEYNSEIETVQSQTTDIETDLEAIFTQNSQINNELQNIITQYQSLTNIISSYQTQNQYLQNELENIQTQYQELENIINQQQTVDVITARDNDVLIMTPDGHWLVLPMIQQSDITFSQEIIETQYNSGESALERMDLFNEDADDWTTRDSFTYTLPTLTLDQNKMLSLYDFIETIDVQFHLYNTNQIEYETVTKNVFQQGELYDYLNVFQDITPDYQFVTDQFNDGIEDIKISIIISLNINDNIHTIQYVFDNWITVNPDIL